MSQLKYSPGSAEAGELGAVSWWAFLGRNVQKEASPTRDQTQHRLGAPPNSAKYLSTLSAGRWGWMFMGAYIKIGKGS